MAKLLKNREILLVIAIIALVFLIALRFPGFVAPANLARVYNDTSILIILALGQMAVILTRCIDLSMAANLALSGMVAAMINAAFPAYRSRWSFSRSSRSARCSARSTACSSGSSTFRRSW
jgi:rhamnose transport system permease protein